MYTTYSQHFFFCFGFCIKLLQQQQQPQFLTKSTPPIFFLIHTIHLTLSFDRLY